MSPQELIKRYCIALTGGIATGKSTVARMLRQLSYPVIDADQLARQVTAPGSPGLAAIVNRFGTDVLDEEGRLNRPLLGQLVFHDERARRDLEAMTHPLIRAALVAEVEKLHLNEDPRLCFYEASLILETGQEKAFRAVWATYCAASTQKQRLMARDQIDCAKADRVLAAQMPAKEKAELADAVIDTSGAIGLVAAQLDALLNRQS